VNNREIERKFTIEGLSYDEAFVYLDTRYSCILDDTSHDLYWKAPNVDFVRLRENSKELTVKVTDRATIVDRIEENVVIEEKSMYDCERQQTLLFGKPLKLTKRFSVFTTYVGTPFGEDLAHISLYCVREDTQQRVFLEVEAKELRSVDLIVSHLVKKLTLTPVLESLYQLFSEPK